VHPPFVEGITSQRKLTCRRWYEAKADIRMESTSVSRKSILRSTGGYPSERLIIVERFYILETCDVVDNENENSTEDSVMHW
jgi:hypothetical protein